MLDEVAVRMAVALAARPFLDAGGHRHREGRLDLRAREVLPDLRAVVVAPAHPAAALPREIGRDAPIHRRRRLAGLVPLEGRPRGRRCAATRRRRAAVRPVAHVERRRRLAARRAPVHVAPEDEFVDHRVLLARLAGARGAAQLVLLVRLGGVRLGAPRHVGADAERDEVLAGVHPCVREGAVGAHRVAGWDADRLLVLHRDVRRRRLPRKPVVEPLGGARVVGELDRRAAAVVRLRERQPAHHRVQPVRLPSPWPLGSIASGP